MVCLFVKIESTFKQFLAFENRLLNLHDTDTANTIVGQVQNCTHMLAHEDV